MTKKYNLKRKINTLLLAIIGLAYVGCSDDSTAGPTDTLPAGPPVSVVTDFVISPDNSNLSGSGEQLEIVNSGLLYTFITTISNVTNSDVRVDSIIFRRATTDNGITPSAGQFFSSGASRVVRVNSSIRITNTSSLGSFFTGEYSDSFYTGACVVGSLLNNPEVKTEHCAAGPRLVNDFQTTAPTTVGIVISDFSVNGLGDGDTITATNAQVFEFVMSLSNTTTNTISSVLLNYGQRVNTSDLSVIVQENSNARRFGFGSVSVINTNSLVRVTNSTISGILGSVFNNLSDTANFFTNAYSNHFYFGVCTGGDNVGQSSCVNSPVRIEPGSGLMLGN